MNLFAAVHATVLGATARRRPRDAATHAAPDPRPASTGPRRRPRRVAASIVAGDRLVRGAARRGRCGRARGCTTTTAPPSCRSSRGGAHADDLRPFPGVEVDVRAGEIWVRSPYLCDGYDGPPGPLRRRRRRLRDGRRPRLAPGRRPDRRGAGARRCTVGAATVEPPTSRQCCAPAAHGEVAVRRASRTPSLGAVLAVAADRAPRPRGAVRRAAREQLPDPLSGPGCGSTSPRLPQSGAGKVGPGRAGLTALRRRRPAAPRRWSRT